MLLESAVIERVETLVRHPVFEGSEGAMVRILDDLESRACANQISLATYRRLREIVLRSPHFIRDN